jgi:hypothetical protein
LAAPQERIGLISISAAIIAAMRATPSIISITTSSTEDWVCPASHDERRFAVFNVSDARRTYRAYFEALVEEIKTGGTEAFFADMLATELGDWHPRNDVPETEGLAMQKQESARPELEWLWNILEEGALPATMFSHAEFAIVPQAPDVARFHALWLDCKRSDQRLRYGFSNIKFGASWRPTASRKIAKLAACSCTFHRFPRFGRSSLN